MKKLAFVGAVLLLVLCLIPVFTVSSQAQDIDQPEEIKYYRLVEISGNNTYGTIKALVPQTDMSYPKNCTLYMIVAVFSQYQCDILLNNQTIATVQAQGLEMLNFVTPVGQGNMMTMTFKLNGEQALVVSYGLTSVEFEVFSEVNLPQIEELNQRWREKYEEWLVTEKTVEVPEDLIETLKAAQEPILISAFMAAIGIALAFTFKWGSKIINPINGINMAVLASMGLVMGVADKFLHIFSGNWLYWIPFALAYLTTYGLYKLPTTWTATLDIQENKLTLAERMFYKDEEDGITCEAPQDSRLCLKRWLRGYRWPIIANGSLQPDWTLVDRNTGDESPLLMINSEDIEEDEELGKVHMLNLAKGGQFSNVDYLVNPTAWTDIMNENQRLFTAIHRVLSNLPMLARRLAEEIIEYLHGYHADEPTKQFRNWLIRTIQRSPTVLIENDIWQQYQEAKESGDIMGFIDRLETKIKADQQEEGEE